MTKVIINGSKGRMGQALSTCAERMSGIKVVAQVDQDEDIRPLLPECDVVIDFSFHAATAALAAYCAKHQKALVIGTTGHTEAEKAQITTCNT